MKRLLKELTDLGPRYAVLTGVSFSEEELGGAAYDKETDAFFTYFTHKEQKSFHGTGDLFASALVGAFENGNKDEKCNSDASPWCIYV